MNYMEICERCETNPAQVRIDSLRDGKRERHLYCRKCADELMGANSDELDAAMPGGFGSFFPQLFGATADGEPGMGARTPRGTATAQRQRKQSKTPTLDQYGRDLTADARDGKLDPT